MFLYNRSNALLRIGTIVNQELPSKLILPQTYILNIFKPNHQSRHYIHFKLIFFSQFGNKIQRFGTRFDLKL